MTRLFLLAVLVVLSTGAVEAAAQSEPSAITAWVAVPADGATSTSAYVEVNNPGMYDIFVTSAAADVAGAVELRAGGVDGGVVTEFTVPAYGSTEAVATAPHLRLVDVKRPLAAGDKVTLTLTTDAGLQLKVAATVRKP